MAPLKGLVMVFVSLLQMLLITCNSLTTILASDCHVAAERFLPTSSPEGAKLELDTRISASRAVVHGPQQSACWPVSAARPSPAQKGCAPGSSPARPRGGLGRKQRLTSQASSDKSLGGWLLASVPTSIQWG